MAIQLHPVDSLNTKLNFWEEFPSFKIHPVLGGFWLINKKSGIEYLKNSSHFMWVLSVCYDRKSAIFGQPEIDKWEVTCEDIFNDSSYFINLIGDEKTTIKLKFGPSEPLRVLIAAFESAIDTPLGISLRLLEKKLIERTEFITSTKYTMDYYETTNAGRVITKKGTADQLDKMFAATDKINGLIQKAIDDLKASEGVGVTKGNQRESLSDGNKNF